MDENKTITYSQDTKYLQTVQKYAIVPTVFPPSHWSLISLFLMVFLMVASYVVYFHGMKVGVSWHESGGFMA